MSSGSKEEEFQNVEKSEKRINPIGRLSRIVHIQYVVLVAKQKRHGGCEVSC